MARAKKNPIDAHIGLLIKTRRRELKISQTALGQSVDISFQQIQKFERGGNRVSAAALYTFSKMLDVPVSYFFDTFDPDHSSDEH